MSAITFDSSAENGTILSAGDEQFDSTKGTETCIATPDKHPTIIDSIIPTIADELVPVISSTPSNSTERTTHVHQSSISEIESTHAKSHSLTKGLPSHDTASTVSDTGHSDQPLYATEFAQSTHAPNNETSQESLQSRDLVTADSPAPDNKGM